MSIYESRQLHQLRMNTSEMEVSVQYKNQKGVEDVFHLPLNNLRQSGKMYNHGKNLFTHWWHNKLFCWRKPFLSFLPWIRRQGPGKEMVKNQEQVVVGRSQVREKTTWILFDELTLVQTEETPTFCITELWMEQIQEDCVKVAFLCFVKMT